MLERIAYVAVANGRYRKGQHGWTEDFNKARLYWRKCDASNSGGEPVEVKVSVDEAKVVAIRDRH
jgi:hypothetical protein